MAHFGGQAIIHSPGAWLERLRPASADDYRVVSWLFLKGLALVYLAAFFSLDVQIVGLVGSEGVLPLQGRLAVQSSGSGLGAVLAFPTVFWLDSSDAALRAVTWTGIAFSLSLFFGYWRRLSLVVLFLAYLSLFHAGQIFMNFQWDYLLLEAGFLAIFLPRGSALVIWLFRWLLFRLRFLSGLSKVVSQDPAWADLTALQAYFETQPLPHAGAWYAHQLPDWLLRLGAGSTLVVELVIPFFFLLPRRWRLAGAGITVLWQSLIVATSNHNFFNLLTILLCLFLLDDAYLKRAVPTRLVRLATLRAPGAGWRFQSWLVALAALVIVPASVMLGWEMARGQRFTGVPAAFLSAIRTFHVVHRYHVFPTMKTERIELVIEGSDDGEVWLPYTFRYKPGALDARPTFVVPHQPRLDWMMWFVPMGPVFLDWFEQFLFRLQAGSPPVTQLLAANPFPDSPPRVLRVAVYRYYFTELQERAKTGHWWRREYLGPFYPLPGVGGVAQ